MKFFPLISIIINSYNGEKYIKKSVNSIIKQSYTNWEIIFWDNNSKDNTKKIIESFKDKRIKYFKNSCFKKLYTSRNLAIKKCKGKYITFLDVDDWWKKNKLLSQINLLNKNKKVEIVFSNFYIFFQNKNKKKLAFTKKLPTGDITQSLFKNYFIGILTILIKKEILLKNKFNSKYEIIGDFDLFTRLSTRYKFYAIQKPLAYYRVHNLNFSKNKISLYIKELRSWISDNEVFFKKKKININYPHLLIKKLIIKKLFYLFFGRVVQR